MKRKLIRTVFLPALVLYFITTNVMAQPVQSDAVIYKKIDTQIKQMTLEEKVGMIHGNSSFTSAGV
ncbi:MAG: hypothetical protein ABIS69_12180, partial [Sediminibacterium sp.]